MTELLKSQEVADLLDVSLRTVWLWTASGRLPSPLRVGRVVRWRRSDLEELAAALRGRRKKRPVRRAARAAAVP